MCTTRRLRAAVPIATREAVYKLATALTNTTLPTNTETTFVRTGNGAFLIARSVRHIMSGAPRLDTAALALEDSAGLGSALEVELVARLDPSV